MNKFKQEIKKLIISFLCVLFCIFLAFVGVNYYLEYQAPSKINKMIEKLQIEEKGSDLTFIQDSDNNDFENYIFPGIITLNSYYINDYEKILLQKVNPYGILLIKENLRTEEQFKYFQKEIETILKRKPVYFIDQEGGKVIRTNYLYVKKHYETAFSSSLENTNDLEKSKEKVYKNASVIAKDLKKLGIDVNLAPVLDVQGKDNNVLGSRIFDFNPQNVKILSNEFIRAHKDNDIELCAKHFIGIGRCTVDTHDKKCIINASVDELKKYDLIPFYNLERVKYGMLSHAIYTSIDPENPAPFSKKVVDFIRNELKFKGILITDALHMKALDGHGTLQERILKSFNSGVDLVLIMNIASNKHSLHTLLDTLIQVKKELFIKNKNNNNLVVINKNLYFN